jgi:flagellar biosynthetic protein FlhB
MGRLFAEKTQPATPYRRQQARREGQVARSGDLAGALLIAGFIAGAPFFVAPVFHAARDTLRESLSSVSWQQVGPGDCWSLLRPAVVRLGPISLGLVGSLLLLAMLANVVQRSALWKPGQHLANWLSPHRWIQAGLALIKTAVTLVVVATWLWRQREKIVSLNGLTTIELAEHLPQLLIHVAAVAAICVVVFGLLDYVLQRWQLERSLRMTPEEMREEARSRNGNPQIRLQRQSRHAWFTQGPRNEPELD